MSQFTMNCPNCNAALTLEDEWKNLTVECPLCKKEFIVPDCTAAEEVVEEEKIERYSSAYDISGLTKKALDGFAIFGALGVLFMVGSLLLSIVTTFSANKDGLYGFWLAFLISLPFGILGIWGLKFTSNLKKPYKKITETSFTNTILIIYGIFNTVSCIALTISCIFFAASGKMKAPHLFIGIPFIAAGCIAIFPVRKFYKLRAKEDAAFSIEEIAAEKESFEAMNADGHDEARINMWRSLARIFAFMGFIPFFGLLMSLLSALFIWLAIKKGQAEMGKIIALAVFTFIIDIIFILMMACQ